MISAKEAKVRSSLAKTLATIDEVVKKSCERGATRCQFDMPSPPDGLLKHLEELGYTFVFDRPNLEIRW